MTISARLTASAAAFVLCLMPVTLVAATPPEVAALFKRLDVNQNQRLDENELKAGLLPPLRLVLQLSGKDTPLDSLVQDVADRSLNLVGKNEIAVDDMDRLLSFQLDAPIALTLRAVLLPQQAVTRRERSAQVLGKWIQVRQSALDEQSIGKPAKLSYASRDRADESVPGGPRSQWNINAAVILNSQKDLPIDKLKLTPVVAYEAAMNSDKPGKDRLTTRVGMLGSYTPTKSIVDSHFLEVLADFTTDRGYDAKIAGVTAEYSPTIVALAIGAYTQGDWLKFRWRPYMGVEYGNVIKAGPLVGLDGDFTNAFIRVEPELGLFDRVKLSPTLNWWRHFGDDAEWFSFQGWAGRVVLSESEGKERVSIQVSYNHGRESPGFDFTGVLETALAIKF